MKKLRLPPKYEVGYRIFTTVFVFSVTIYFSGCNRHHDDGTIVQSHTETKNITFQSLIDDASLTAVQLNAVLVTPEAQGPLPAVVVMHGSGGLWKDNNAKAGILDDHFQYWANIFQKEEKVVVLFIDSYGSRGIEEFHEVAPPLNLNCSAEVVRPRDAYAGLEFLSSLPYVNKDKIAIMGFSHGASTVLSTIVDADAVRKSSSEKWYVHGNCESPGCEVPGPSSSAHRGGFVTAVAYYPGAGFYGYFGSTTNANNGEYVPYAPVLIQAAGIDPLYTSGYYQVLIQKALNKGSSTANNNEMVMYVYDGAKHSFDEILDTSTIDGKSQQLAETRTREWLNRFLR